MQLETLFDFLKKQGFSITLLGGAIIWFNSQYNRQQIEIETLRTYITTKFEHTVDKNTEALIMVKIAFDERNRNENKNN